MLRTLGLFFTFLVANAFLLPLIWSSFVTTQPPPLPLHNDHNAAASATHHHDAASETKVYVEVPDLKVLALLLSGSAPQSHQYAAMATPETSPYTQVYYTLTVENFHLQSDFKLLSINPYTHITREVFDLWLEEQEAISFSKILGNIGDNKWSNELVSRDNVSLGAVIASPSKSNPDYFYQWIRDGAITMVTVVNYLTEDKFANSSVSDTVMNYIENTHKLQQVDNPSGVHDEKLLNLGEPKFEVDGSPYTGSWGRPQNDGPALRVIAIDNFLKNLKKYTGHDAELYDTYHKVIKPDLEFICRYWKVDNFDLWEETFAHHFFTSLVQLKALKIGLRHFQEFNDDDAAFGEMLESEFSNLLGFIWTESGFINPALTHIVETPALLGKRSGLDVAVLLASLLTHNDDDDLIPFDVSDGLVLNTLSELIKSMKFLYPINLSHVNLNLGVGLGRYPEDVYNGLGTSEGNPWFLCTLAGAELMYKLISDLYLLEKDLIIDSTNELFFFTHIFESPVASLGIFKQQSAFDSPRSRAVALRIPYNTHAFNQTMGNLFQFGDSFLEVVREHVADDGSMSEQFNKYTGYMQGAEDLTWSHGSLWGANRWRKRALQYV